MPTARPSRQRSESALVRLLASQCSRQSFRPRFRCGRVFFLCLAASGLVFLLRRASGPAISIAAYALAAGPVFSFLASLPAMAAPAFFFPNVTGANPAHFTNNGLPSDVGDQAEFADCLDGGPNGGRGLVA